MKNLLKGISFEGIVLPGETYVFTDRQSRSDDIDGLDIVYTIRSENELREALEMEIYVVVPEVYSIKKVKEYLGWKRLSDDCCQFLFSCTPERSSRTEVRSIYLQRLMRFSERLELVKDIYPLPTGYLGRR